MSMPADVEASGHHIVEQEAAIDEQAQTDPPWYAKGHPDGVTIAFIMRKDEWNAMHQVGRVLEQQAALDQSFADEGEIKIREVANPTMHKFCGFAARAAREIHLLHQRHVVATRC